MGVMQYFTREWSLGLPSDADSLAVVAAYWRHVDRIEPQLPPSVRMLARSTPNLNLHDGLFRAVASGDALSQFHLRLRCGDVGVGYYDLDLWYERGAFVGADDELES